MKDKFEVRPSKVSGLGLFALEDVSWGTRLIEYTGERISNKESNRREKFYDSIGVTYLFEVDDKWTIDGLVKGNISRFINHSNVKPNVCAIKDKGRIYFHAYTDIAKGDELLFDYGFDPA